MIQGGSRIGKDIPPYTLIGRDPIVYCGINIVGLRRRGFTNSQVFLIQDIYRTLYTRGLNNTEALKAIETEYEPSEERDLILNFINYFIATLFFLLLLNQQKTNNDYGI